MKLNELRKHERLCELLRELAFDIITFDEFWSQMKEYGLTDEDIDRLCSGGHVE
jgi:hypothetical protein